ncbi:MAG: topoisomerase DNA-binding C4 zinc finger domain-containing protein [Acidimicrobiaceae bacterium]|nr:topoisomerase DNA-binding C4 zinc finger domain-containing protein [Acidimicrobiaceae bacterium]
MTSGRVDSAATADAAEFPCPRCGSAMVRRVAKRGENEGNEFWGCSTFPKCRSIVQIEEPNPGALPDADVTDAACPFSSPPPDPPKGLLKRAVSAMDGIWRWSLEAHEPDATDRWKPKHRKQVLDYLHIRDGERCGLCGGKMKLKGAQVEHVVPKRFAVFELTAEGEARQGTYYTSVLHGMENLQAAHPRCNKYKGNAPDIRRWRHPSMPRLVVAKATDGRVLMLPPQERT